MPLIETTRAPPQDQMRPPGDGPHSFGISISTVEAKTCTRFGKIFNDV
jgi:hypothetical protein